MDADSKGIELEIDPDPRFAAAAGGAARYFAEAAGLQNGAVAELQKSIVVACKEAFEHLTGNHPRLKISLKRYPDRIEIALAHEGDGPPAAGLDRIAGFAEQLGSTSAPGGIDRVQYETREGLTITRLTKYLGDPPRIS